MSSDFRGPSGDDILPGPPQPQQLHLASPTGLPSEGNTDIPSTSDWEKPADANAHVGDDNSVERDGPDTTPSPATAFVPDAFNPSPAEAALLKQVDDVLTSGIGIATLLNRLKQSIASAKEFASFLKKRAILEDDHAQSLKKLCRTTQENMRRADHRQGSFAQSYDEMMYIHDRMAENGIQFAASLHQMHEDLVELANNSERGRKTWKSNGLAAEQRVIDLEQTMRKSKAKYDSLAEEYDRARTGEGKQGGKVLGAFKAHKSAAQQEEDLLRKVQNADQTYNSHVQTLQTEKTQLETAHRPVAVKTLQGLVSETDAATTLQMQKFAAFNEKLLLGNGLIIYPFKNQPGDATPQPRSLRQAVSSINNERDLNEFVSAQLSRVQPAAEVKYEKNPLLKTHQSPVTGRPQSQPFAQAGAQGSTNSFRPLNQPGGGFSGPSPQQPQSMGTRTSTGNFNEPGGPGSPTNAFSPQSLSGPPGPAHGVGSNMPHGGRPGQPRPYGEQMNQQHSRSFSQGNPLGLAGPHGPAPQQFDGRGGHPPQQVPMRYGNEKAGAPQLGALPFQGNSSLGPTDWSRQNQPPFAAPDHGPSPHQGQGPFQPGDMPIQPGQHPQGKPPDYETPSQSSEEIGPGVFGISLEKLRKRDGPSIPMIVLQCIQAVSMYGIRTEYIYRSTGAAVHVNRLKALFDASWNVTNHPALDFRDPENFYHDIHVVTSLLKQFFRELPDPLLGGENYFLIKEAAMIDDRDVRRDSLHAIINTLPEANYATLYTLAPHLQRIKQYDAEQKKLNKPGNEMGGNHLAVCIAPSLIGTGIKAKQPAKHQDPSGEHQDPDEPQNPSHESQNPSHESQTPSHEPKDASANTEASSAKDAYSDVAWQIRAVDTIVQHAQEIFALPEE